MWLHVSLLVANACLSVCAVTAQATFVLHESFQNPKRDVEVGARVYTPPPWLFRWQACTAVEPPRMAARPRSRGIV